VVINSFTYNNKFTKGKEYVGANLSAVLVTAGRRTGGDADLAELLASYSDREAEHSTTEGTETPQEEAGEGDLPF